MITRTKFFYIIALLLNTFSPCHHNRKSLITEVRTGIATGWTIEGRSSIPGRVKNFLLSAASRLALGPTQLPIQRVPGALSPGVKQPGREADHSPQTSAEVKKTWICIFKGYRGPIPRGKAARA
jgi:hypothetical protein